MSAAARRWLPLALLLAAAFAVYATGLHRELSLAGLQRHRSTLQELVAVHPLLAPVAFVALREPIDDVERVLRGFAASRLVAYKVPVRVVVLPELPKLPGAGKLDRTHLRRLAAGDAAPGS